MAGIEIENMNKILRLEVDIRIIRAAGAQGVCGTDRHRIPEGYLDGMIIILLQEAVGNDVKERLPGILPIFRGQCRSYGLQLHFQSAIRLDSKGLFQRLLDGFPVLILNTPKLLQFQRAFPPAGVRDIEHIPQTGLFFVSHEQGDTPGSTLYIAILLLTPGIKFLAEGGIRPLCVDHNLFRVGEAVVVAKGG